MSELRIEACHCHKNQAVFVTEKPVKTTQPIDNPILRFMQSKPDASVFSSGSFVELGNPDAIRQALSRLGKAWKIRRIPRGLYDSPRSHPITGQTAPDITATVRALM